MKYTNVLRNAFTLVELLVLLALGLILLAILLPAIQSARESSRRSQCSNNIRQCALGVDLYHDGFGRYPPGEFLGTSGAGPKSRAWSWLSRILPFVEQQAIFDRGQVGQVKLEASSAVAGTVRVFLCPSDAFSQRGPRLDAGNLTGFAVGQTNYKGVSGANWGHDVSQNLTTIGTHWPNPGTNGSWDGLSNGDGMMFRNDLDFRRDRSVVTDGLSNTLMIGEALPEFDRWCSWPYSNNAYSTCAIPLNAPRRPIQDFHPLWWPNVQAFRSRHVAGANFAYADGSVRFVSDSIELSTYRACATIAGGEVTLP